MPAHIRGGDEYHFFTCHTNTQTSARHRSFRTLRRSQRESWFEQALYSSASCIVRLIPI